MLGCFKRISGKRSTVKDMISKLVNLITINWNAVYPRYFRLFFVRQWNLFIYLDSVVTRLVRYNLRGGSHFLIRLKTDLDAGLI